MHGVIVLVVGEKMGSMDLHDGPSHLQSEKWGASMDMDPTFFTYMIILLQQ
jgi:hypothetical protein